MLAVPDDVPTPARVTLPPLGRAPSLTTEAGPRDAGQRVLLVTVAAPDGDLHALRLAVPLDRTRAILRRYATAATAVGALTALCLFAVQGAFLQRLRRRIEGLGAHMAARLSALAQQLLDVTARRVAGSSVEEGDLADVARQAVAAMRGIAAERGVTLAVEGDESSRARFDREAMARALANLLDNATRFAPKDTAVVVRVTSRGDDVALEVEDAGDGVPVSERTAVFEAFHRVDRSGAGAGLGLAIVREVARQHGGDAWVEEGGDGGARFVVAWPREGPAARG